MLEAVHLAGELLQFAALKAHEPFKGRPGREITHRSCPGNR